MMKAKWCFSQSVVAVVLSASIFVVVVASGAASPSLDDIAQQVAAKACPFAMLQSYGCPIEVKKNTTTTTTRVFDDSPVEGVRVSTTSSNNATSVDASELFAQASTIPPEKEKHWNPGDVPIGIGFNTATMKVGLPMFYPVGTKTYVFDITVENKTYSSIEDYGGSISPTAMKALMTGSLSTDTGHIYKTFFGSYSFLHRTTLVDIIAKAKFDDSTPPKPLPEVEMGFNNLPTPYNPATDAAEYKSFFEYFGTHVVTEAAIGGALESLVSIKSCFASGRSTLIANDAKLAMATKTLLRPTSEKLNQAYVEHSSDFTCTMYGGDPTLALPSEWKKRERSIAEQPVLIKVDKMEPISSFLTGDKATAMSAAITDYQNNVVSQRDSDLAKAKAAQVYKVQAATAVEFQNFKGNFNYRHKKCTIHIFFCEHYECKGETACFVPGSCGTGCGDAETSTIVIPDTPSAVLKRGESKVLTPDAGQSGCQCSGSYGGFQKPEFPFNKLDQSVTCTVDSEGQLQATNVNNPKWDEFKNGGSRTLQDGEKVKFGCSIATATYSGMSYDVSGGNQGCGATHGTLHTQGTIVSKGYCCMDTTLAPTWNGGSTNCKGNIEEGSCPGFNN